MGVDLATWRARIGLNYYHKSRPLQTRWRSRGGRLYQPGVASWGVGEVMNDTPLVFKGCMTVVTLSLVLQYIVHSWSKLKRRGGSVKVHCYWWGSTSQVRGTVDGGGTLLLRAIVVVTSLLLVIAGDVETNPGPEEPNLRALLNELHPVRVSWYKIGLELSIPHTTLDCFQQNNTDQSDLMCEMLKTWLKISVYPTWEAVVAALRSPSVGEKNVAAELESKYCTPVQQMRKDFNSPTKVKESEELCLGALLNQLHSVRARWYNIGLQLGIPYSTLDCFKQNYSNQSDLMREMLKHWLQTAVKPYPTWEAVVTALRSPAVSEMNVAEQLESKHCTPQQPIMYETKSPTKAEESEDSSTEAHDQTITETDQSNFCSTPNPESPDTSAAQHSVSSASANPTEHFVPMCKKPQHDTDTEYADVSTSPLPCEESQKPPFGCWCVNCKNFSFTEKGSATLIPSISSFPYLDLSGHNSKQKQKFQGRLCYESRKIMMKFQKLVIATKKSLTRQNVSPSELFTNVMTLGALKPVFKGQLPALHHCFEKLKAAQTISESFVVLNDYFSFFNYHMIEQIIEELGTEEDKSNLQRYKHDFINYARRRIFKCPPEFGPLSDADHAEIYVKLDLQYDDYTVAETECFHQKLCEILSISQSILRLCRVDEGCFQLMFQVPSSVQERIFPLSQEQEEALADMEVIRLTCREYQFQKKELSQAGGVKKHQHDPDDDSGMGPSIKSDGKSTAFCENSWDKELKEPDYELKVQHLIETASSHKSGSDLELHHAAAVGKLNHVTFLLKKRHCNPLQRDQAGFTSFHVAAIEGNVQVFKYFITECNCNAAYPGPLGLTPLHLASEQGHLDVVKYLVTEQQIEPLCEDAFGNTPLHRACASGCQAVAEFLTSESDKYLPITKLMSDLKNKWNSTPLHNAALRGHLDIIRYFISDQNCDPDIPGEHGRTPLHLAAEFGYLHIVKYLTDEQGCNPSCLDEYEYTPLHCAAMRGSMTVVKFLTVEKHCDPMCRDSTQTTPLHRAALSGHIDVVKFLTLKMHCDPMSRNNNDDTAINPAIQNGHLDILKFFIFNQNCDPHFPVGQYGRTPLHTAAEWGHLHIVKYLTDEQGCNPSCLDDLKYTPLYCAAMKGHVDIVKFLAFHKRCDPMYRDSKQNTPLHRASVHGHIGVVKFLTLEMHCDPKSRNGDNYTAIHLAAENGHLNIVQLFISNLNCEPNILGGQYGETPLHIAAQFGHVHIVKYLIDEQGCNPSCLDDLESTPLHHAVARGHIDTVKFLTVEKHCDPMSHYMTALHCAVMTGHLEILKFLIEELKCPPDILGPFNMTPLQMAENMNQPDIVQYLQKHSVIPYITTAITMMKVMILKKQLELMESVVYASKN